MKQSNASVKHNGKILWRYPWSYKESIIISFTLIIIGFIIEFVNEVEVHIPPRPVNFILLFTCVSILLIIHFFFGKSQFVKWLSSVPCSVSAISSYAVLVLFMGVFFQEKKGQSQWIQDLGFDHLKSSWPFLFIELYLFISLGLVVLRRSYPLTGKNLGFLLNHFGLWLTLIAVAMGSGDIQKLRVSLFEKADFMSKGINASHQIYNLPFSLKLLDFKMNTYNPKIMLSDSMGTFPEKQKGEILPVIEEGFEYKLNNYKIKILNILPFSARTGNGYMASLEPMAATAALVYVENEASGDTLTRWICSGSAAMLPEYILLDKNIGLWLLKPEPKQYESLVVFRNRKGDTDTVTIEVNKPYKTSGWSFYQTGYDEKLGRSSQLSILEAVYDPWLPLVYTGIILMIAGALYLFWLGRGVKNDSGSLDDMDSDRG